MKAEPVMPEGQRRHEHRSVRMWLCRGAATLMMLAMCHGAAVHAEGSRDLHPAGALGKRAWLEYNTSGNWIFAGIPRQNSLEVYVQPGEVLALGSSIHGYGGGVIRYTTADGSTHECATGGTGNPGRIVSRAQELSGPRTPGGGNSAGYPPCFVPVQAGEGGIWRVQFLARSGVSQNPPTNFMADAEWASAQTDVAGDSLIAAWDITVFSGNTALTGRVWADYLPFNAGNNNATYPWTHLRTYILTNEGYLFEQEQMMDPWGYHFFANSRGFLDSDTGRPIFKSIATPGQAGDMPAGFNFHRPHLRDSADGVHVTHKQFFNLPDTGMPGEADYWAGGSDWLRLATPTLPPDMEAITFTGVDGTDEQAAGVEGGGGTFHFINPSSDPLSAQIVIPLSLNGSNVDRVLNGLAMPGAGTLEWDGLDGAGNPVVTGGTMEYEVTAHLLAAEVHFPFFDVERSESLKVTRLNGPAGPDTLLYWDHSLVTGSGQPTPLINLGGLDSTTTPAMVFPSASVWGNEKGLDAWTYTPSASTGITAPVVVRSADLRIVKQADFEPVARGGAIAWTLTVENLSADTFAYGARVNDVFVPHVTDIEWTCEITEPGQLPTVEVSACGSDGGSGHIVDARVDLRSGGQAVFRVRGTVAATVPGAVVAITNTATVSRAADAADPLMVNNESTATTPLVPGHVISGRICEDVQPNDLCDPGEHWNDGVTVWVSLLTSTGNVVQSTQVLAGSGQYLFEGVPDGAYQLVLTNTELSTLAIQPAGFVFTSPANGLLSVVAEGTDVGDQDFGLFRFTRLEGRVFEDNGAGGGIAHDGLRQGGERGLGGVPVLVLSNGNVITATTTAADGLYELLLPPGLGEVEIVAQTSAGWVSVSEHVGNTGADNVDVLDDRIVFMPSTGAHYTEVNFGDVREPLLAPDQIRSAAPGSSVFLPHVFTAHSAGEVSFEVVGMLASPDIPGWDTRLFVDEDCDGVFDSGEGALTGPVAVDAGANAEVCLLVRVFAPAGAPMNAQFQFQLQAQLNYLGTTQASVRRVDDLVTVSGGESLLLLKQVDRATALPGETLTYTLVFQNPGDRPVTDIVVRDATPGHTVYVGDSARCVDLPPMLGGCVTTVQPSDGEVGNIEWTLTGALPSGAEGRLEYRVRIEQ